MIENYQIKAIKKLYGLDVKPEDHEVKILILIKKTTGKHILEICEEIKNYE